MANGTAQPEPEPEHPRAAPVLLAAPKRAPPTAYSEEMAERCCEFIAMGGTLGEFCAQDGNPDRVSLWRWRRSHPNFDQAYLAAQEARMESLEDLMLQIANDGRNDTQTDDETGAVIVNHDNVRRAELRVKSLQWVMERRHRQVYGSQQRIDMTVTNGLAADLDKARARLASLESQSGGA